MLEIIFSFIFGWMVGVWMIERWYQYQRKIGWYQRELEKKKSVKGIGPKNNEETMVHKTSRVVEKASKD